MAVHMAKIMEIIVNGLKEALVAVVTSHHDKADKHCLCTCWLAQVMWSSGRQR